MRPDESDASGTLRDLQEESGDEGEMKDMYVLDQQEAEELGVDLDPLEEPEPPLD